MKNKKDNGFAYFLLIVTSLFWGITWAVGRLLAVHLPSMSLATVRYGIAVPLFFIILWIRKLSLRIPKNWIMPLLMMGLFSVTLYQAFFLFGVKYTAASDASIIMGIEPILIALLAVAYVNEPIKRGKILGFVLGFLGIIIISYFSPNTNVENRLLGYFLVFGAAIVYAIYTVHLRNFQLKNKSPSSLLLIAWISLFGWLMTIPFALLEKPWTYTWNINAWLEIVYLALFSTVVGYLFYVEGVARIGATRSGVFINLVPVFGVLSSALLLSEVINFWHLFSFILIFMGVWFVNK